MAVCALAVHAGACQRTPAAASRSHVLNLSMYGLTLGEERAEIAIDGQRQTIAIRTSFSRPPGVRLDGRLVIDGGRPVSLRVDGNSPAFLPSAVDVTVGSDRADTFPVRSPLPIHALWALARRSSVSARRKFRALPDGVVTVAPCSSATPPYTDATCHELLGITWGAVHLFLDRQQMLAAAVIPTPWGLLLATTPERDDSHVALMEHYARARAARLAENVRPIASAYSEPLVFTNVRVIHPAGNVEPNATVIVTGSRIGAIGSSAGITVPEPARVIDGRGLSLFPGLRDMHAHLKQPEWGPAYLAAGVTAVRDLGNEEPFILALREISNAKPYPTLTLAAFIDAHSGSPYTVVQANTPDEGRRLVRHFRKAGFDEIKVWNNVTRDVLPHITSEAHQLGMRVTGHVPDGMTAFEAIAAGLDGINHIDALVEAADGSLASANGKRLLAMLLERKVVVDPTLVVLEYANRSTATPVSAFEPGFLRAPQPVQLAWNAFGQPPPRASGEPLRRAMALVRALHAAGVPIVAGTDQGVPGHTLHRELELYVRAGLSPREALATAAATDRVEAGGPGDVVLLEGNPDIDISDIRRVRYVVKGGRLYDPATLWRAAGFEPPDRVP
jgi:imidazolonepropionase-like amidohydrolase